MRNTTKGTRSTTSTGTAIIRRRRRSVRRRPSPGRSTPARCIRRSCAMRRAIARSAAWRWCRSPAPARRTIPSCATSRGGFWVGVALSIPLVVLAMAPMIGIHEPFGLQPRAARLGRVRARHAGRAVGRLADPAQVLALARAPRAQHVHADRAGRGARLPVQPRRGVRARPVPAGIPRARRRGRHLFRGRGGDRDAGDARRRPAVARDGPDQPGDPAIAASSRPTSPGACATTAPRNRCRSRR